MAEERVAIYHPADGVEYGVTERVYEEVYKPKGFKIRSYEDGRAYAPPEKPKTDTKPAAAKSGGKE